LERAILFASVGNYGLARREFAALAEIAPQGALRRFAVMEVVRSSAAMGERDAAVQILAEELLAGPDPDFGNRICAELAILAPSAVLPDALKGACAAFRPQPEKRSTEPAPAAPSRSSALLLTHHDMDGLSMVRVLIAHEPSVRLSVPAGTILRTGGKRQALPSGEWRFLPVAEGVRCSGPGMNRAAGEDMWLEPRKGQLVRMGDSIYGTALHILPLGGQIAVVQHVPLEMYLRGVLPGEMPSSWPLEAQKAQAVAARTYALAHAGRVGRAFDMYADERSQVYLGQGAHTPQADVAVRATHGQILTHKGKPFSAYYHADSGGWLSGAGKGFPGPADILVPRPDPARHLFLSTPWRVHVDQGTLLAALNREGHSALQVTNLAVGAVGSGGRVLQFDVATDSGSLRIPAPRLKALLGSAGPRSLLCRVARDGHGFVFIGQGHGHGVGMSQYGAMALARSGMAYREILSRYYAGAQVVLMPGASRAAATVNSSGGVQ